MPALAELVFNDDDPNSSPRPLIADAPDRVWHIGTFSKVLCPGLRVGWLVAPRRKRDHALELKRLADLQSNTLTQSILEAFLLDDDFDQRLRHARRVYLRKARALAVALRRHLPDWRFENPQGGFSIWIETGSKGDEADFLATAVRHRVNFDPGNAFETETRSDMLRFRLCYSLEPVPRIIEGVSRLARAWSEYRSCISRHSSIPHTSPQ